MTQSGLAYLLKQQQRVLFMLCITTLTMHSCWLSSEQGTIYGFVAPMLVVILVSQCQNCHNDANMTTVLTKGKCAVSVDCTSRSVEEQKATTETE